MAFPTNLQHSSPGVVRTVSYQPTIRRSTGSIKRPGPMYKRAAGPLANKAAGRNIATGAYVKQA